MKNVLLQAAMKLNTSRRKRTWLRGLLRVTAMLVVFCTTYALILPAITMEGTPECGVEEHIHSEACYTVQTTTQFQCGLEEGAVAEHSHGEFCYDPQGELICPLPQIEGHTHEEACYTATEQMVTETRLICDQEELEAHTHEEACYGMVDTLTCQQEEVKAHSHEEGCYTDEVLHCDQEETAGHSHEEGCYTGEEKLLCEKTETAGHAHAEDCYTTEEILKTVEELTCGLPQTVFHAHTEDCLEEVQKQVFSCELPEHIHKEECYPVEEDSAEAELPCGSGVHSHVETCYDEAGTLICSIPEHTHDLLCTVEGLDRNADVESAKQWQESLQDVQLTDIWSEDLLAVAASQLGYAESTRNVVLKGETLKGYTRYGDKYGDPYGDWAAMFVSFCLEYAGITEEFIPYAADPAQWVEKLTQKGLYVKADTYAPVPGDLVFLDADEDGSADHVGIFKEVTGEGAAVIIAGDTGDHKVETQTIRENIAGYGILPVNPLTPEQLQAVRQVASQLQELPEAAATRQAFDSLNQQGDKAGHEALRQELVNRMDAILALYETFTPLQKERVGSMENLEALKALCGGDTWKQTPALTEDHAVVTGITGGEPTVTPSPDGVADPTAPADSIRNGDRVTFPFTVETASYYTDIGYGEARVKVELVLPYTGSQAAFDLPAMTWLEDGTLSEEIRTINGAEVRCQVLTGYKHLTADEEHTVVVPGSFTQEATVTAIDLPHGSSLQLILSSAMERGTWEGLCQTHQIEEKLTVLTEGLTVHAPLSAEEQQMIYEGYLLQLSLLTEGAAEVEALMQQIAEEYARGALTEDHYADLHQQLLALSGVDLQSIAEPSVGNGWIWLETGDPNYQSDNTIAYTVARRSNIPMAAALPPAVTASLELDSNSQIPENGWGGENSADDLIWVSKTIEGTKQENVFDITLQIITKDEVNEVYKEPDMAVVMVMDISNTMVSIFSGETTVTRYNAAMDSAEQFLKSFAEETDGVSRVGYVAFNTHGHEVFPMQECSTTAQANTLSNTMRTKTKAIMDNAAKAAGGSYASSRDRFTNIEAGLAMAADMLKGVNNRHKYIIFLSDGFPTTYMTASTSDGYKGYDPYTSSGTNGNNGVFYDGVMGHHCDYGTSYSDTAAIKARQKAVSLKNEGVNIFSIGVDVEGQTIWQYHWDSQLRLKTASTVERRKNASYYNSTGYEIGTLHSEITAHKAVLENNAINVDKYLPSSAKKTMSQDFKDWLKGTATTGIGSGYYYESTDQDGLEKAYAQIFEKILEINAESAHLDWVATDPMPDMGVHELDTVEFIGFWDYDGNLKAGPITGQSKDGALYLNTASFNTDTSTISWDLKNSGFISTSYGNNKNYLCALKYRVRLQNENEGFVEKQIYDTNDTTFLNYRIVELNNGVTSISDRKYIEFPIPKVFGYLAELNFRKVDPFDRPLAGAEFTLTHDTEHCGTCRGDGEGHVTLPVYQAVSGADGVVAFQNIPSGHHYILEETNPPAGYTITENNTYRVAVSYDALTVTVTDADGNPLEWTASIENAIYYTLPHTGGTGTSLHIFGGLLLVMTAACGYVIFAWRKRQKGGASA